MDRTLNQRRRPTPGPANRGEPGDDAAFSDHPKSLFYLAFTEAWERFSYYGMTSLLALYMVNHLLLLEHAEHVSGFAGFRADIESIAGPLVCGLLAQVYGWHYGFGVAAIFMLLGLGNLSLRIPLPACKGGPERP